MVNIGFGNSVNEKHIISIVAPGSLPSKRMIQNARDKDLLVDATMGKKTRSVIVMNSGHVVASAIGYEALSERCRVVGK